MQNGRAKPPETAVKAGRITSGYCGWFRKLAGRLGEGGAEEMANGGGLCLAVHFLDGLFQWCFIIAP